MLSYEKRHVNFLGRHTRRNGGGNLSMFNLFLDYSTITTVSNTTAETPLLGAGDNGSSKVLSVPFLAQGKTFFLSFGGALTFTGAPTLTIRLKLNDTTIRTFSAVLTGSNCLWKIDTYVVVSVAGANGTIIVEPCAFETSTGTSGAAQWNGSNAETTPSVDLSIPRTWNLTAEWNVADALNLFQYRFGLVNLVR